MALNRDGAIAAAKGWRKGQSLLATRLTPKVATAAISLMLMLGLGVGTCILGLGLLLSVGAVVGLWIQHKPFQGAELFFVMGCLSAFGVSSYLDALTTPAATPKEH